MGDTQIVIEGLLNGLPFLLSHFFISILLLVFGTVVYIFITPMKEIKLIRDGNIAAALSFSGALIGIALPLSSSLKVSNSISEIMIWGLTAILIQIFCFKIVDILIKDLPKAPVPPRIKIFLSFISKSYSNFLKKLFPNNNFQISFV